MTRRRQFRRLTDWQRVLMLSTARTNFAHLPVTKIMWPSDTWMRRRLAYVRQRELVEAAVGEAERAKLQGRMQ